MTRDELTGRWTILEWVQTYDDGRVTYPMGKAVEGFIEYGSYGMFCFLTRSDRAPFTTGGQWSADDREKAAAYNSCLSYAGDFEVDGDQVVHHVRHSLFPNWVGGTQRRHARLDGDTLSLTARLEEGTSEARTAVLVWCRARPGAAA